MKLKTILISIFLIFSILFFYRVSNINYEKYNEIKYNTIKHPEFIAKKETAKLMSFGFSNIRADLYWLEVIQYVGGDAIGASYKKYLYIMLDLITELNPYFEKPYLIGELLLPNYSIKYEDLDKEEIEQHINEGILIGKKGVDNFCDKNKVDLIKNEYNLLDLWNKEIYKNPCFSSEIPFYLGYIYYFYKKDGLNSSSYYKISSANENSLQGAKTMSAIMQGKGGDREKSMLMFLNLSKSVDSKNNCSIYNEYLENIGIGILNKKIEVNSELIKNVETNMNNWYFKEEGIKRYDCDKYILKSVRELNMLYVENGNSIYLEEEGENAIDAKELFRKGYIKFLPTDFQQSKNYGIIYFYNKDIKNYDYKMGFYSE